MTRWLGLLLLASPLAAQEPPTSVEVLGGAGVSVSEESAVVPHVEVIVDAATYAGSKPIGRLRAAVKLLGSPDGTAVNLQDIRTFQGVEANFEFSRRVGSNWEGTSETLVGANCGFAARRDSGGLAPNERFPTWCELELVQQHRDEKGVVDRRIALSYGANTMVTRKMEPRVAGIRASARLMSVKGVGLVVGLDAQKPVYGQGRGLARVTTSMAMSF